MDPEEKLKRSKDVFKDFGAVAVYVYGSVAEGREDEHSDLDIAVLFEEEINLEKLVKLRQKIQERFEREIDLNRLNTDDIVFKKEVIEKGNLVFDFDREKRIEFEIEAMRRYTDMKPYIERYNRMRSSRVEGLKV